MNRINVEYYRVLGMSFPLLESLEKTRQRNLHVSCQTENYKAVNVRDSESFVKVFESCAQIGSGAYSILREAKIALVKSVGGWEIKCNTFTVFGYIVPTSYSVEGEQKISCAWSETEKHELLLDWGWNTEYFFGGNVWGHDKCPYKISDLTIDEIYTIMTLLEQGQISYNYYVAYTQIQEALHTGIITTENE